MSPPTIISLIQSRSAEKERNTDINDETVALNAEVVVGKGWEVKFALIVVLEAKEVAKAEATFWRTSKVSML